MKVGYEWDIEEMDGEDIVEHNESETLAWYSQKEIDKIDGKNFVLVLVRNEWNEADGLTDRYWAYTILVEGKLVLPEFFSDISGNEIRIKVPQQFHRELQKLQA